MTTLPEWIEEQRLFAKFRADQLEHKIFKTQKATLPDCIEAAAWRAREGAFREIEREMGYEVAI